MYTAALMTYLDHVLILKLFYLHDDINNHNNWLRISFISNVRVKTANNNYEIFD